MQGEGLYACQEDVLQVNHQMTKGACSTLCPAACNDTTYSHSQTGVVWPSKAVVDYKMVRVKWSSYQSTTLYVMGSSVIQ